MHLSSIYLIVNDFEKSILFYEKLLKMTLPTDNNGRFVSFEFEGHCISIMNGHFDTKHPDKVVHQGEYINLFDNLRQKAIDPNTHKFVLNFWIEDLQAEYNRIKELNITENLSKIKYMCYVAPYYYFNLTDSDGNIIEVTGGYTPKSDEFYK